MTALSGPPLPPTTATPMHCFFRVQVGIAVGMLALLTAQLSGIQTTYPGTDSKYFGRPIQIQYCMFSSSTDARQESRCKFGYAVASVSLVLSFIWSYMQVRTVRHVRWPQQPVACTRASPEPAAEHITSCARARQAPMQCCQRWWLHKQPVAGVHVV